MLGTLAAVAGSILLLAAGGFVVYLVILAKGFNH